MTKWLERKEKIYFHERYIAWRQAGEPQPTDASLAQKPEFVHKPHLQMTIHPTMRGVPLTTIITRYRATFFKSAFSRYVALKNDPSLTTIAQLERRAADISLPFNSLSVFHNIKFWNTDAHGREETSDLLDSVHIKPGRIDYRGKGVAPRFDTVLVNEGSGQHSGISGYRVAQLFLVFTLPNNVIAALFATSSFQPPKHLAYVEWFTPFKNAPEPHHKMYKISRSVSRGERVASIIPVSHIRRSVHLFPQWGRRAVPREWTSASVLEDSSIK
ncbi:hypothetical protein BD779DRAFT_1474854 [Infundibulicybe gibba]|nr:hypothetical protein BD779DRAFT_1474854 [Infundibulicybe gibba]